MLERWPSHLVSSSVASRKHWLLLERGEIEEKGGEIEMGIRRERQRLGEAEIRYLR